MRKFLLLLELLEKKVRLKDRLWLLSLSSACHIYVLSSVNRFITKRLLMHKNKSYLNLLISILFFGYLFSMSSLAQDVGSETESPKVSKEEVSAVEPKKETLDKSVDQKINEAISPISHWAFKFIFADVSLNHSDGTVIQDAKGNSVSLPLILIWLAGSAILYTIIFKFINFRLLGLAFRTVKGKYSKDDDPGEITHFQALTAALSGTVGLGNIAGVAIAVGLGGAGAIFWMILIGIFGMTTKFCECTLGVKYRKIDSLGKVRGGAMYYLQDGLKERKMEGLGKTLAVLFAIMCVCASFGGGNMFQVNQARKQVVNVTKSEENKQAYIDLEKVKSEKSKITALSDELKQISIDLSEAEDSIDLSVPLTEQTDADIDIHIESLKKQFADIQNKLSKQGETYSSLIAAEKMLEEKILNTQSYFDREKWVFGVIIAVIVAIVIIGGISSIAKVTEKLVPFMCGIYIIAALIVIFSKSDAIFSAFGTIFNEAFKPEAGFGAVIAAFIQGARRAAFSNEAGFGSAPIAHSAVKTKHPASEGLVALLEPFFDTVVVCTLTGLVIVITGMHEGVSGGGTDKGIELTSQAFEQVISWFPYVLTACVILFAFSTMISWSYYGQQAWAYLFGKSKVAEVTYKAIFCLFIVAGASLSLGAVIDFSDAMLFGMAVFNLIGVWILFPVVKEELVKFQEHANKIDSQN